MTRAAQSLELPSPARVLGAAIAAFLAVVMIRPFAGGGAAPGFWPLVSAVVSVACLIAVGSRRDPARSFMRAGFHLGAFAFFMFYPLLEPENVGGGVPPSLRDLIGWMILMMIIGFELAYWGSRLPSRTTRAVGPFELSERHRKQLSAAIYLGLAAWFVTVLDDATSAGVAVWDLLMTMRGQVAGGNYDGTPLLGGRLVLVQRVLAGGGFLAATAASVLITAKQPPGRLMRFVCWSTLLVCALVGFVGGSRAMFFYAFAPLAVTCWLRFAQSKVKKARWLVAAAGVVVMVVVWSIMSAMRGSDIRTFSGSTDLISPEAHAQGALDIYSALAVVVQGFPEVFPYQHGRSLIPLMLGWVPRVVWPEKPYPFSLYMNFLNGESLERRAASLAVGIPGEGYGNFGLFGVFLWGVLAGLCARRGDDYIGGFHPDHPLRLLLASLSAIWMALIVRGGIPEMFYMGLTALLLPWGLSVYLARAQGRPRAPRVAVASVRPSMAVPSALAWPGPPANAGPPQPTRRSRTS
jgi:hypothetical protein